MAFDLQPYGGPGSSYDDFGLRSSGITVEIDGVSANANRGDLAVKRVIDAYSDLSPSGAPTGTYTFDNQVIVEINGVSANLSRGTVLASAAVVVGVSSTTLTASLGTISAGVPVDVTPTGVAATGSSGSIAVTTSVLVTPPSVELTASLGNLNVQGAVEIDGTSAIASLGAVSPSTAQVITPTGVSATGSMGSVSPNTDSVIPLSTTALSGGLGTIVADVPGEARSDVSDLGLAGVPGGTYSDFTRGQTSVTVDIEAVEGASATRGFDAWSVYHETDGVAATGDAGDLSVSSDQSETLTGVAGTSSVGDIILPQTQVPLGVGSVGEVGGLTASAGGDIVTDIPSVSGSTSSGTLALLIDSTITPTGVNGTSSFGIITATGNVGDPVTYTSTYTRLGLYGGVRRAYAPFSARFGGQTFILGTASIAPAVNGTASLDGAVDATTSITPASLGPIEMNTDAA